MSKKILYSGIAGLIVFVIGASIYGLVENVYDEDDNIAEVNVSAQNEEESKYIARVDGDRLNVYSIKDENESFMYTLNVRIEDIGQEELAELKRGVVLNGDTELASFKEDFTS